MNFETVSREIQEGFEEVPGCLMKFSRVCQVIEVYGNFKDVSKNIRGILGKCHGCHREICRVFQECFPSDSSILGKFQRKFQEGFKDLS